MIAEAVLVAAWGGPEGALLRINEPLRLSAINPLARFLCQGSVVLAGSAVLAARVDKWHKTPLGAILMSASSRQDIRG